MFSRPTSPAYSPLRSINGRLHTENVNSALPPKRSFAQHEEDPSQLDLKRHHVRPQAHSPRRVPLDPLSASSLENRRSRRSHSADARSHHSLVAPLFVPDLRALHPEQPVSSGYGGTQPGGAFVCSWPPPTPSLNSGKPPHSNFVGKHASQRGLVHGSDVETTSRATYFESTSNTSHSPLGDSFRTEFTTIMDKSIRTASSVRPRTSSMPSAARPPAQLWRSDSAPMEVTDEVDIVHPPTPPGLHSYRLELTRSSPDSNLLSHGSSSLSLALGSQPLSASEHTKPVPPIGAERSRVVSMIPPKARVRSSSPNPARVSSPSSGSPWCPSPVSHKLDTQWNNKVQLLDNGLVENVEAVPSNVDMSKEGLERLLRHAIRNNHAPKIISPLSPLRTSPSAADLASDPNYRRRMPSQFNCPSPRYAKCPPGRARTDCDVYQSFDWDTTCVHCQECKRDSVGKKLLAFRYRQQQTRHVQRSKLLSIRGAANTGDDDRMVVANRIRKVFAYEMDEEEKSLWEEVAAVTGAAPVPFSHVGSPCAVAHCRPVDDGIDDGNDNILEMPEDRLLGAESATLFRDVSVY